MTPFDLQAAIAGAPIATRAGELVQFIDYNEKAPARCQVVVLYRYENFRTYSAEGRFRKDVDSPSDLFMLTTKRI